MNRRNFKSIKKEKPFEKRFGVNVLMEQINQLVYRKKNRLMGGGPHNRWEQQGLWTLPSYQSAALTLFLFLLLFHLLQHLPSLLQLLLCVRRVEPFPEMPKAPIIILLWGRVSHVFSLRAVVT